MIQLKIYTRYCKLRSKSFEISLFYIAALIKEGWYSLTPRYSTTTCIDAHYALTSRHVTSNAFTPQQPYLLRLLFLTNQAILVKGKTFFITAEKRLRALLYMNDSLQIRTHEKARQVAKEYFWRVLCFPQGFSISLLLFFRWWQLVWMIFYILFELLNTVPTVNLKSKGHWKVNH